METRKRHIPEDGEASLPKKRALIDVRDSPSPHLNGTVTTTSDELKDDNLERFRKEAIYRRMKHYSREFERSQGRIAELERWRRTCEAGLAALEACWTQLVDTTRSLTNPEDALAMDVKTNDLFDLSTRVSESESALAQALHTKVEATKSLLIALVQRGAGSGALQDKSFQKLREAQSESAALRSEVAVLRSRISRIESERDGYYTELVASEKRNDRLKSQTVQEMNGGGIPQPLPDSKPTPESAPDTQSPVPLSSPPPAVQQSNGTEQDPSEWQAIATLRDQKIVELENELSALREQLAQYPLEHQVPSETTVLQTSYYKALLERYTKLEDESTAQIDHLRAEVEKLESGRSKFEEDLIADQNKALQELKTMLTRRDNENTRLREQRDQQQFELAERKQKDSIKADSLQELKLLCESRAERITVLQSEVTRLRTQLAANVGNADLLAFFFRDQSGDADYISDLQSRLKASESRATALEQTLSGLQSTYPDVAQHIRSEVEARERLVEATSRLQAYVSAFGDISQAPPDVREREEEIQRLKLQLEQSTQASSALDAELDRLSAAWEALDRQVKSKVFDLSGMEERLNKAMHEKGKLENKFYSAMRDKEASETERKVLARNNEKQAKALERLVPAEKNLTAQMSEAVNEVKALNKVHEFHLEKIGILERELAEWKDHAAYEKTRAEQSSKSLQDAQRGLDKRRAELRRMEEDLVKSKKDLERQAAKAKAPTVSSSSSSKEAELQSEVDMCMSILKCSTCRMRMRNTVITKCMHSFCKECVDARISTRQRKCPACNLPFAQSDVAQVYFQ